MDFSIIIQAIATVGFPICAFFVAVYALKYAYDKSLDQNREAFSQIANLTKAVNNNTQVLTELVKEVKQK